MRTWSDAPASVAEGSAYYSYVIQPSPNASWPLHTIYNVGAFHDSGFSLDVIGQPHFLFRRNLGGSTNQQAVIHEWFNGTSWISDEIFRGSFYDSSTSGIRFALTADGFVHAVWQPSDSTASVWYGTNRSGTWEAVKIEPSGGIGNLGSYRIAVNPDGTAFVLLGLWDKAVLFTRPSGITTFTEEEVPTGNIDAGWYDALELRPFGTRIAIFFEFFENSSGSFKYPQMCLIKDQGSWNQPTQLVALPSSGNYTIAAASPNGRLVYGVNTPDGPRVFTLDSNQTWNSILLTPSSGYNQIQLGFNNQNKFWCAINGGWGPQPGTDIYAWYSE
jgi:hypothetical protein